MAPWFERPQNPVVISWSSTCCASRSAGWSVADLAAPRIRAGHAAPSSRPSTQLAADLETVLADGRGRDAQQHLLAVFRYPASAARIHRKRMRRPVLTGLHHTDVFFSTIILNPKRVIGMSSLL